jgi:CheY-like chemotaxis protein
LRALVDRRVLVVDNNPHNCRLLDEVLGRWGFEVESAADADAALRSLLVAADAGRPFHVAIIDHLLRGVDGESLGCWIRERPQLAATQLVLMTRLGQRGDAQRLTDIGFAGYLPKPVKRSLLIDCLLTVLKNKQGAGALVTQHTIAEARRRDARLLVAEDNRTNQLVILAMLKKLGFDRIDVAQDGEEAIDKAKAAAYDLILMDCLMPKLDGYEASRELRRLGMTTPIVAITANVMAGDIEHCADAGMNDHLAKPLHYQLLAKAIEKWLPAGSGEDVSLG